jgi:hypothetical protein
MTGTLSTGIALALIIVLGTTSLVSASPKSDKERERIEKVKAGILSLGTGPETQLEVSLRDKTKLSGSIVEAGYDSFVIADKGGMKTTIAYAQVAKVKGHNWSTRKTIAVTAVIVGALAIIYFAFFHGKHL